MLEVFLKYQGIQGCLFVIKDGGPKNVFRSSETVVQACCLGALLQGNLDELFGRETPNADILRFFSLWSGNILSEVSFNFLSRGLGSGCCISEVEWGP